MFGRKKNKSIKPPSIPSPPSPQSGTAAKKNWVFECEMNITLSESLDIFDTFQMSNPSTFSKIISVVRNALSDDMKNSHLSMGERSKLLKKNIAKGHPHELICEYLFSFAGESWLLIKNDREFARWAVYENTDDSNPIKLLLAGCLKTAALTLHPEYEK